MRESEIRNQFVLAITDYLGASEGDNKHQEIVRLYNSIRPLPVGYTLQPHDSWCAATPSAIAHKLGLTDIIYPECSCGRMIDLYQKHGRWVEDDAYVPLPGDLIMYDWDDNGKGDNRGGANHVGTVVRVTGGTIRVIEGNTSGHRVAYRDIPVNGKYIRGFCCPDYASKATPEPAPSKFKDVDYENDWFAEAVDYAAGHGLMVGVGNGKFEPHRPVTRAELAAVATSIHKLLTK